MFAILIIFGWAQNFRASNYTDYVSFWAAGKLALQGNPVAAYDLDLHRAIEMTVVDVRGVMPFPYPPTFLLIVTPFSTLPYVWAFAVWVIATVAFYGFATRRVAPAPFNVAHPSVLMNGLIGQNAFLTTGIFTLGTSLLRTRPFAAGAILGLLVVKPQLALLLPVAVIAARAWRAVAGAMFSSLGMLLLALIAFGPSAYENFTQILPFYAEMMRQDKWSWGQFISVFAFVRWFGIEQSHAMAVQIAFAAVAIGFTWIAWTRDWEEKIPVLAAATLLPQPYLLTYDSMLLVIPIGYWLTQRQQPYFVAITWLLCALPIAFYFHLYWGPNTVPLAAIFVLCTLALGRLGRIRATHVDNAHLV